MRYKIFVLVLLIFSISTISSLGFDNPTLPKLTRATVTSTTSTSMNISTNFTNFTQLLDTPSSYSGQSGKCTAVNGGETGLEFVTCGTGGGNGSMDYTNVALINQTNTFEENQSFDKYINVTETVYAGDVEVRDFYNRIGRLRNVATTEAQEVNNIVFGHTNITLSASGGIVNATILDEDFPNGLVTTFVNFTAHSFFSGINVTLTKGTYEIPQTNYIYMSNAGVVTASITPPTGDFAWIGIVEVANATGSDLTYYALQDEVPNSIELIKNGYERAWYSKPLYETGIAINIEETNLSTTSGTMRFALTSVNYGAKNISNGTIYKWVDDPNNPYSTHITLEDLDTYQTNETINVNKFFNVVIYGLVENNGNNEYYVNVQNKPSVEYTSVSQAEADVETKTNYQCPSRFSKTCFRIARVVLKRTPSGNEIQTLSNGLTYRQLLDEDLLVFGGTSGSAIGLDEVLTNNPNTDKDIVSTANLTLGQKITFALGEIIDNIQDGWIRITGNVNVTGNLTVQGNYISNGTATFSLQDLNTTGGGGGGDANLTNVAFTNESNVFTEEQNIKNDLVVGDNTSATYRSLKFTRSSASDYFNEDATFTLGFRKLFFDSSLELNKESAQSTAVVNAAPTYLSLNCHIDRAVGKSAYCDSTVDYSLVLTFNETVEIRYSASGINDGLYTVNSSSFNGTTTNITLNEAIPLTIPGFELGYIADQDLGVTGGAFIAEPMLRNGNSGKGAIFSGFGGIEGTNWGRLGDVSVAGNFFGNKGASLSGTDGNINTLTSVGARYYSAAAFGGTFNLYKQISLLIEYTTTGSGTINVNDSAEGIRITNYPTNGHTVNLPKQIQMFIEKPTRGDVNYGIVINGTGREASISFGGENQSVLYSDSNNNVTWDTNLYLTGTGSFEEIIDRTDPPNETEDGRLLDHFNNLDDLENMTDEELHLNLAGGFCEERKDFDRPVKVPVYKEICYGEFNQTLLDYYNQTFGLNTLNQEQQRHLRDSMVEKCEMGWDEEITYPYNFTSCGYLLNKEVLNNHFAIGEYRQATDIQETLNNESALVGNIVVANQFVTNTTRDTNTFVKLQSIRNKLHLMTSGEMISYLLNPDGSMGDNYTNDLSIQDETGLGSYLINGGVHYDSVYLGYLLWKEGKVDEQIAELQSQNDMMAEDLCSLGVTRWC